jgi:hypothetical protein
MTRETFVRSGKGWLLAIAMGAGAAGCESPHKVPVPPPLEETEPEVSAPDPAAEVTSEPAVTVAKPTPKPVERFTVAPMIPRRTLAHILEPKARIGVYLGLPAGWRNDDPSYLLLFPEGKEPRAPVRAVAMTLFETGLADANKTRLLRRGAEPTGFRDGQWTPWKLERIGKTGFKAAVALGTGRSVRRVEGPRSALAVVVDIPGAPALGFLGSWATDKPELEPAIVEMLRGLERCQIEVGRGCVTAAERKRASL